MKKETHSHLAKAERCRMEWEAQHSIKVYCFSECVLGAQRGERYVVPLFITVEKTGAVTATQSKNQALTWSTGGEIEEMRRCVERLLV